MNDHDRNRTYRGWCCTDCLFLLANGDTPSGMTEAETAGYLEDVARHCEGSEVTLGMFAEDHACAVNYTVRWLAPSTVRGSLRHGELEVRAKDYSEAMDEAYWALREPWREIPRGAWLTVARAHELETAGDRGGECDCEQLSFSSSSCDMCGSHLAGAREAVVFWLAAPPAPQVSDRSEDPATARAASVADIERVSQLPPVNPWF